MGGCGWLSVCFPLFYFPTVNRCTSGRSYCGRGLLLTAVTDLLHQGGVFKQQPEHYCYYSSNSNMLGSDGKAKPHESLKLSILLLQKMVRFSRLHMQTNTFLVNTLIV